MGNQFESISLDKISKKYCNPGFWVQREEASQLRY
jgi:hypothetical protein